MKKSKTSKVVSFWLLVIGGLNWLLVGILGWDIGQIFGGQGAVVSRIIYILVGLSALCMISSCRHCCVKGHCNMDKKDCVKCNGCNECMENCKCGSSATEEMPEQPPQQ